MTAADVAHALRGRRSGEAWLCRCPVESHGQGKGDRRPSLHVKDGYRTLLVTCFGGCDRRDVLDALRRRGLLEEGPAHRVFQQPTERRPEPDPEPDVEALTLWRQAQPIGGTLAELYLRHRGIDVALPATLRFLRSRMIAAVQRADRKVIAVQLTRLRPDGRKAAVDVPRLTIGRLGTGAVHLAPAGDVLGLAEGVETALSAMQVSGVPCWATLGGHRLGKVLLPDGVREVHLFADADAAGRLAADTAADRYTRQGRRVVVRFPSAGKDFNDALRLAVAA